MGLIAPRLQASRNVFHGQNWGVRSNCHWRVWIPLGEVHGPGALCRFNLLTVISTSSAENGVSVRMLNSFSGVALVGRGPSVKSLKCMYKWFMFIGMGSSEVCSVALILLQKIWGLLVFKASSLACNSAIILTTIGRLSNSRHAAIKPTKSVQFRMLEGKLHLATCKFLWFVASRGL